VKVILPANGSHLLREVADEAASLDEYSRVYFERTPKNDHSQAPSGKFERTNEECLAVVAEPSEDNHV
jgi:hypothetical protein